MQHCNRLICLEFIAGEICTSLYLTSCTTQAAYPVTSASHFVFDLALSTSFFIMEHVCVSHLEALLNLLRPCLPTPRAHRPTLHYLPGMLDVRRYYRTGSTQNMNSESLTVNQSFGPFKPAQSKV